MEELRNSTAEAVLVSKTLADELYKLTGFDSLKTDKAIVISRELINKSLTNFVSTVVKGKGGRPRIPEPENPEKLVGKDLLKYKNRNWKRSSRANIAAREAVNV